MDVNSPGLRLQQPSDQVMRVDLLRSHPDGNPTRIRDQDIRLTPFEQRCLALLARHRGQTVTKAMFLRELYPDGQEPEMKIVDVFICKLRRKLRLLGAADIIETLWGRGYVLR